MRAIHLTDKVIATFQRIHDYAQVHFEGGSLLNIFNDFAVLDVAESSLAGSRVTALEWGAEFVRLHLAPAGSIRVGMAGADYRGPEALQYISGQHIVTVP